MLVNILTGLELEVELGLGLAQAQAQQCPGSGLAAGFLFAMAKGQEGDRDRQREGAAGAVWVATAIQFAWQHPLWVLDETAAARSWDTLVAYPPTSLVAPALRWLLPVVSRTDFCQFIYRVLLINILK